MSPVSPVFHTEVTVIKAMQIITTALKRKLRMGQWRLLGFHLFSLPVSASFVLDPFDPQSIRIRMSLFQTCMVYIKRDRKVQCKVHIYRKVGLPV